MVNLKKGLISFFVLCFPLQVLAQVSLSLSDTTLDAGTSGAIEATISTDGSAVALQFDVLYDPSRLILGTVNSGSALTANHAIASNPISPGRDRIVITTSPVTALNSGVIATINLSALASAPAGTTQLAWDGVVISDNAAQPITPASLTPGTITINAGAMPPSTEPEAIPATPVWALLILMALIVGVAHRMKTSLPILGRTSALGVLLLMVSPLSHAQGIPGDANGDGRIDVEDVRLIVERILERGVLPGDGDCNRDSTINVLDTVCSQIPFVPGETAPIILGPGDRSIPADVPFEMNLFAADPDTGATQSWELISSPAGLAVSTEGVLTWTPGSADEGGNPVAIRVTDDTARTDEATFSIEVFVLPAPEPENGPPQLTIPADQTLPVGTPIAAQASATDPDAGDDLTFRLVNGPDGMTIDPDTGALSWTPQSDQAGLADVVIEVSDEAGESDFGSFIVEATPLNTGPTAVDDLYLARVGETLTVPVPEGTLANDSDPEGDPITGTLVTPPTNGVLNFNSDGSFDYTPAEDPPLPAVDLELLCELPDGLAGTNGTVTVADVDQDGQVEVVGSWFRSSSVHAELWVADPNSCTMELEGNPLIVDAGGWSDGPQLGILDVDGDGDLEIIGTRLRFPTAEGGAFDGQHLLALNHDGTLVWPGNGGTEDVPLIAGSGLAWRYDGPSLIDLDGDGVVEIVMTFDIPVAFGATTGFAVFDSRDGSLIWEYDGGVRHSGGVYFPPVIVDLDLDGTFEIIGHSSVIDHEGNLEFELATDLAAGTFAPRYLVSAVANFDGDPFPEILARDGRYHYLFEHDGTLIWQRSVPNTSRSQITVADFDEDGQMEFAYITAFGELSGNLPGFLVVYDTDGESIVWSHEAEPDYQVPGLTRGLAPNATAYDADNDGIPDIVVHLDKGGLDDDAIFIFDGENGDLFDSVNIIAANNAGAVQRFMTIADIDGDDDAEIISSYQGGAGATRIWTGAAGSPLPSAPPLRNQWLFDQTLVNADSSFIEDPVPYWLQPGLNGDHIIRPSFKSLESTREEFTYTVSDGDITSAAATVHLDVRPQGNAPIFVTEPDTAQTRGIAYRYIALAADADLGDVVTYSLLVAPPGMTVETNTGVVEWYPEANGEFAVTLLASDTVGFATPQLFTISVGDPVTVPDVVGDAEADAETALTNSNLIKGSVSLRSDPSIPAGVVIEQQPIAGSVAEFGAAVALLVSTGAGPLDTDDDSDTFTENQGDCDDGDNSIFPGAVDGDGDGIDQDCDGIDGNKTLVAIELTPDSKRVLTGEFVRLTATGIFDDGTAQDLTEIATWTRGPTFVENLAGDFIAEASFSGLTGSANLTVVARSAEDLAPVAEIETPAIGDKVTELVEIVGTASDDNFLRYELSLALPGDTDFITFDTGELPVVSSTLGQLDPTSLINDQYTLRLTVYDQAGNQSISDVTVQVDGGYKPGQFSIAFVDLDVPVSGVPITVLRHYDSRETRSGDFGVGWQLDVRSIRLRKSRELGSAWNVQRSGLSYLLLPTDQHKVSVTLSDGRVEEFDLSISPTVSPIVPFPPSANRASFVPRPGTRGQLRSLENTSLTILDAQPGNVELLDDLSAQPFNPDRFIYTAENGTEVYLSESSGVEKVIDKNGNTLTFDDGGIVHSSGAAIAFSRDDHGRIVEVTDPAGNAQQYAYDGNGDLTSHTDREGNTTRFFYDRRHKLIRIDDPTGTTPLRSVYDDSGRLIKLVDADGNETLFDHDLNARQEVVTDRTGATTVRSYDPRGNLLSETNGLGNTTTFSYDDRDNLLTRTDAEGHTWQWTYNSAGLPITATDPTSNTVTREYDANQNLVSITDERGLPTEFEYDTRGNLVAIRNPDGGVVTMTFDAVGNLISSTDQNGNTARFVYDANGRTTRELFPTGARVDIVRDALGMPLSVTESFLTDKGDRSYTWQYFYDANGNLVDVDVPSIAASAQTLFDENQRASGGTDASGVDWSTTYDARGNVASSKNEHGSGFDARYDPEGRPLEVQPSGYDPLVRSYDAAGAVESMVLPGTAPLTFTRDRVGQAVQMTDPAGNTMLTAYDAAGRVVSGTDGEGNTLRRFYDEAGNLERLIDLHGNEYTHVYDSLNRRTETLRPDGLRLNWSYDSAGNLVRSEDAFGLPYEHEFNALNQLVQTSDPEGHRYEWDRDSRGQIQRLTTPAGKTWRYDHDVVGNLTSVTSPTGLRAAWTYDGLGRITDLTRFDNSIIAFDRDDAAGTVTVSTALFDDVFAFDSQGNLLSHQRPGINTAMSYDAASRLIERTSSNNLTYELQRDGAGRVVAMLTTRGAASFQHDANSRTESVAYAGTHANVTRSQAGIPTGMSFPSGLDLQRTLTAVSLPQRIELQPSSGPVRSIQYGFDGRSRITSITDPRGDESTYTYDAVGRIASSSRRISGGQTIDTTYSYDVDSNLTRVTRDGVSTDFTYDEEDRLLNAGGVVYQWDPNGNLIATASSTQSEALTYDPYNRLTRYERQGLDPIVVTYAYHEDGLLRERCRNADCTYFLWDRHSGDYPLLAETVDGSGALLKRYLNNGKEITHSIDSLGQLEVFFRDHLGSPVEVVDAQGDLIAGVEYDEFGIPLVGSPGLIGWNNAIHDDDTGLLFLRSRWYSPGMRRFTTMDSEAPDLMQPISVNRYAYAANDPLNRTDPSGQFTNIEISISTQVASTLQALGTTLTLGAVGGTFATAFLPGGIFNGPNSPDAKFTKFGVQSATFSLRGGLGLTGGLEHIAIDRTGEIAHYLYFGTSVSVGKTNRLIQKLGRLGVSTAIVGLSQIYNVPRATAYEGFFSSVSYVGNSFWQRIRGFGNIRRLTEFRGLSRGVSIFASPGLDYRDENGRLVRPAWGWRAGQGLRTASGPSIGVSFTYYILVWSSAWSE